MKRGQAGASPPQTSPDAKRRAQTYLPSPVPHTPTSFASSWEAITPVRGVESLQSREMQLAGCQCDEQTEWAGPFTFVVCADTQLGFAADPSWGGTGDGSDWSHELEQTKNMVRCVNKMTPRPRFVTICGDLIHSLPEKSLTPVSQGGLASAERYANTAHWLRQNEDFKRVMSDLEVPLVCVCGNHDVGDRPTADSLLKYTSQYGPDYFGFWCGGLRALVLNSQLLNDPKDARAAAAAQEEWLDKELVQLTRLKAQSCAPKHVVVFQHIPWFLKSEHEAREGYFNLSEEVRRRWLSPLKDAGVSTVFCGHYHRNAVARTDDQKLEVVVTSAVGRQMSAAECKLNRPIMDEPSDIKSGFRIVKVGETAIEHQYYQFDDLEAAVINETDKV